MPVLSIALDIEAEGLLAAIVQPLRCAVAFDVAYPLAGAIAPILGADKIVKTSLLMPLPVTSPPRSIMCKAC